MDINVRLKPLLSFGFVLLVFMVIQGGKVLAQPVENFLFLPVAVYMSPWQEVGPGSASGGGISKTGLSNFPAIAVSQDGEPYVTWVEYRPI